MCVGNIDPSIKLFADIAYKYCIWAESELRQPQEEMQNARQLLAELHLVVIGLPNLEIIEKACENADRIRNDKGSGIFQKFSNLPIKSYWDVFNPLEDTDPIVSSLADDLTDIYLDVKKGLVLFESSYPWDAAWEWRFNFQIHWGRHLVGAQRAIHEYLSGEDL
jgi:Domain of unknown function (DUF5063)